MWHRIIVLHLKKLGRASCKAELEVKTGNQSCLSHEPNALLHGTAERVGKSRWYAQRSLIQGQLSQRCVALLRPGGLEEGSHRRGKGSTACILGLAVSWEQPACVWCANMPLEQRPWGGCKCYLSVFKCLHDSMRKPGSFSFISIATIYVQVSDGCERETFITKA